MRRWLVIISALALAAALTAGAWAFYFYGRNRFTPLAVAVLRSVTGLDVNFRAIRFRFLIHPAIRIEDGELSSHGRRLVSFKRLTVYYHYRSLLRNRGLPLTAVVLEAPRVELAATPAPPANPEPYATQFVNYQKQASDQIRRALNTLGAITLALDIEDASVVDANGAPMVREASLELSRKDGASGIWQANFRLTPAASAVAGALISGRVELVPADRAGDTWAQGKISLVGASAVNLKRDALAIQARPSAQATVMLGGDGRAAGTISLELEHAVITSALLKRPTEAANYSFGSSVVFTGEALRVEQAALKKDSTLILNGEAAMTELASAAPQLTLKVGGLSVNLAQAKPYLAQFKTVPAAIVDYAGNVQSGRLTLEQADLSIKLGAGGIKKEELIRNLHLAANLTQGAVLLARPLGLPALSDVKARLALENNHLTVSELKARLGNSAFTDGSLSAELNFAATQARFIAHLKGNLALGELYRPALGFAAGRARALQRYVKTLDGASQVDVRAEGRIGQGSRLVLGTYKVEMSPRPVLVVLRSPVRSVKFVDGTVTLVPGLLTVKHLHLADDRSHVFLDGSAKIERGEPSLRRLLVELRPLELKDWLSLAVQPKEATATGRVEGQVSLLGTPVIDPDFSAHGRLSAAPATVKLGILRSPINAKSIVLNVNGRGAKMVVDEAEFEGEKASLKIDAPDITRPVIRLGIDVARLDLHALKFVHFPGEPKPRPKHLSPDTRISGHVKIDRAQVDRLAFSQVTLDFDRRGDNWTVSNIRGAGYGGNALLNLVGRSQDDIIDATAKVKKIDVAWLLTALEPNTKPVLSGRLNADATFRVDTENFKRTLKGSGSFRVSNGTAYRLKLLAQVLSLMSVSGLLHGRLPDPFVEGIPFRVLKADLTSKDGVLHTKDLVLDGPVLRLSTVGYLDLPTDTLNLTVGVMPFNIVDNVLSLVPLVGRGLASQESILAIYVTATGKASDPLVLPAPLTSVTEIIRKILSLPANIINSELKSSSAGD